MNKLILFNADSSYYKCEDYIAFDFDAKSSICMLEQARDSNILKLQEFIITKFNDSQQCDDLVFYSIEDSLVSDDFKFSETLSDYTFDLLLVKTDSVFARFSYKGLDVVINFKYSFQNYIVL